MKAIHNGIGERWLIEVASWEISAHRLVFFALLVPLVAFWLPAQLSYVAILYVLQRAADAAVLSEDWYWISWPASLVTIGVAFALGLWRQQARLADESEAAMRDALPLPSRQGKLLTAQVDDLWRELGADGPRPEIVHRRSFDVLAHAYDDARERSIELSSGLAQRIVHHDPLGIAILRHEMAHLVHSDLPAIRRHELVTAGGLTAITAAFALVAGAALWTFAVTNFVAFPLPLSVTNVLSVNLVIVLGLAVISVPLLVGALALRRYAGFVVALVEMRADVSAGAWGEGITAMSELVEDDRSVRRASPQEIGLAYLSPSISHIPVQERADFLRNPVRLVTPKLRYFAVAVLLAWLLPFHQGTATWDTLPVIGVVALLHASTTGMLLIAGARLQVTLARLLALALALLLAQALPALSLDGPVYLLQHLIAAIVRPGGFGSADAVDYLGDVVDVASEFGGKLIRTLGGPQFPLALAIVWGALWAICRTSGPAGAPNCVRLTVSVATVVSLLVGFDFFQAELYRWVRAAAFAASDVDNWWPLSHWVAVPDIFGQLVAGGLWAASEYLDFSTVHGPRPWPVLVLPQFAAALIASVTYFLRERLSVGAL